MSGPKERPLFSDLFPPESPDHFDDEKELEEMSNGLQTQRSSALRSPTQANDDDPPRASSAPPILLSPVKDDATTAGRNKNELPDFLKSVGPAQKAQFLIQDEFHGGRYGDGKTYPAVYAFATDELDEKGEKKFYPIPDLTHPQLRSLLGQMKVKNYGSLSKFMMRVQLANTIISESKMEEAGDTPELNVQRKTNTLLRIINICFHSENLDDFLHLNDNHKRVDHESKRTYKDFWGGAIDQYLDKDNNDEEILDIHGKEKDRRLEELAETDGIDLKTVNQIDLKVMKLRVRELFKVRSNVLVKMGDSGQHSDDPWNFMQAAVKNIASITMDAGYYFHKRCDEHPEIDEAHQVFMDPDLMGNSKDTVINLVDDGADNVANRASINRMSTKRRNSNSGDKYFEEFQDFKRIAAANTEKRSEYQKKMSDTQETIKTAFLLEKKILHFSKKLEQAERTNDEEGIKKYKDLVEKFEEELVDLS